MKIPISNSKEVNGVGFLTKEERQVGYIPLTALKMWNITAPLSMKELIKANPDIFKEEESEFLLELIESDQLDNITMAWHIIDSKPEPL